MKFKPRIRYKDAVLFYIVLSLFTLMGIVFWVLVEEQRFIVFFITLFPALLLFLVWQQTVAKDMRYELQEEGMFLKRFFMKRSIP